MSRKILLVLLLSIGIALVPLTWGYPFFLVAVFLGLMSIFWIINLLKDILEKSEAAKHGALIIWLVLLLVCSGMAISSQHKLLRMWNETARGEMISFLREYEFSVAGVDSIMAYVLVTPSQEDAYRLLEKAERLSQDIMRSRFEPRLGQLNHIKSFSKYSRFWGDINCYFEDLLREPAPFTEMDRENFTDIQKFCALAMDYMDYFEEIVQKKSMSKVWLGTQQRDKEIQEAFAALDKEVQKLTLHDTRPKPLRPTASNKEQAPPLLENERTWSKEEAIEKAREFMGSEWDSVHNAHYDATRESAEGLWSWYECCQYTKYLLSSGEPSNSYHVRVTRQGGHIYYVFEKSDRVRQVKPPLITEEEAIARAETWIKRWGEKEMALMRTSQMDGVLFALYVPTINDIPIRSRSVNVQIDMNNRKLKSFDATSYYLKSGVELNLTPVLSQEEVVAMAQSYLSVRGEPHLEVLHSNELVYVIPVSGIERVNHVYISATDGSFKGSDYTHPWQY